MKRRTFLLAGLGTSGALVFGWSLLPPRQRLLGATSPYATGGAVVLNGWVTIAPDDTVTVVVPKAEMGQGIHTALAMILAEELECAWEQVRVAHGPIDRIYGNVAMIVEALPLHPDVNNPLARALRWMTAKTAREMGVMMTGSSSSVRDCWMPMREAGASARASLVAAAAAQLGVSASECRVERGAVVCGTTRLRYGALASAAAALRPSRVTLKSLAACTLMGKAQPRLGIAETLRGAPTYGIDVRLPGMRFAAVEMSPTFGATPISDDRQTVLARPGVRGVVTLAAGRYGNVPGVAVVADTWWLAQRALTDLRITWSAGTHDAITSDVITTQLREAAAGTVGLPFRWVGDSDRALSEAATTLRATYEAPFLAHAALEPPNATVRVTNDGAELWVGTQVPGMARAAVAHEAGVPEESVRVHQYLIGGGFGRRLDVDFIAQATAIAKATPGIAVQTIWSRENDLRHDLYRPAAVSDLRAALDANGTLTAFVSHSAGQAPLKAYSRRVGLALSSVVPDRTTAEGTWDQPYEFAAFRAAHAEVDLPVPVGMWRAVGHSHQAFFVESFLDEIAAATQQDPAVFRASLLQQHPRALRVLKEVVARSSWSQPLPPTADGRAQARGIALHESLGTIVAEVAEISLMGDGTIQVHRVVVAVDCGFAVNPNMITQQVESAIVFGLSAALHGAITIERGAVREGSFGDYRPLRMAECPVIETHILPSMEPPSGVGEPPLPPIAPAVANALCALTGARLRALPLRLPAVATR